MTDKTNAGTADGDRVQLAANNNLDHHFQTNRILWLIVEWDVQQNQAYILYEGLVPSDTHIKKLTSLTWGCWKMVAINESMVAAKSKDQYCLSTSISIAAFHFKTLVLSAADIGITME